MGYTDGAWQAQTLDAGMGWILKNDQGSTITHGSSSRQFVPSALAAEALAIREALTAFTHFGSQKIQVNSDSQVLISLIKSGESPPEIAGILLDIRESLSLFPCISFKAIARKEDSSADSLAKAALFSLVVPSSNGE
ncbi:unnamed protein product [Thlaspi arvense]|uniref:RNase H type-1 domain-containing protein n=1 Tax=Thlaspi arvense TaxID=13288 RepID=A0AAU9RZJ9_THLAR|nr:unnamed protein product [Thlaspi arvense]